MFSLSYEFKNNIPFFKCTYCGKCSSCIESKNYLNINRGCCWYFPKYTLVDIKNILNLGKKDFILSLYNMPNAEIKQYDIIMKGLFDIEKYKKYKSENYSLDSLNDDNDNCIDQFNPKLFFRLCPFLKTNGCSLDYSLRPHPCNLYLCRNVISLGGEDYKDYSRERKDYYAYCTYFNEAMKYLLIDNKVDFLSNFNKSLDLIGNFDMPSFEPCNLKEIHLSPFSPQTDGTDNNRAV